MGNDGGSIPRRIELVKEKAKDIKLNPDLERAAAWLYCALSKVSHSNVDRKVMCDLNLTLPPLSFFLINL